jgi:hypothetical protein
MAGWVRALGSAQSPAGRADSRAWDRTWRAAHPAHVRPVSYSRAAHHTAQPAARKDQGSLGTPKRGRCQTAATQRRESTIFPPPHPPLRGEAEPTCDPKGSPRARRSRAHCDVRSPPATEGSPPATEGSPPASNASPPGTRRGARLRATRARLRPEGEPACEAKPSPLSPRRSAHKRSPPPD